MRKSIPAHDYERGFQPRRRGFAVEPAHRAALQHLEPRPGETILDLGCGAGPLTQLLADAGAQVIGVDYSVDALAVARAALPSQRWARASATELPFASASFDKIACLGMLGYLSVADLRRALTECERVLAHHGTLLVCTGTPLNWLGSVALGLRAGRPITERRATERRTTEPKVRSHLYAARTYRRELRRLGFAVRDWVTWDAEPNKPWASLARPFFAPRWFVARKTVHRDSSATCPP